MEPTRQFSPSRPSPCAARSRSCPTRSADRKSTRLNSSHITISYAVFCLKKKKNKDKHNHHQPEASRLIRFHTRQLKPRSPQPVRQNILSTIQLLLTCSRSSDVLTIRPSH